MAAGRRGRAGMLMSVFVSLLALAVPLSIHGQQILGVELTDDTISPVGGPDYVSPISQWVDLSELGPQGWRVFATPSTASEIAISAVSEVRPDEIYNSLEMRNSPLALQWSGGASASPGWDGSLTEQRDYRQICAGFEGAQKRPMTFSVRPESTERHVLRIYLQVALSGGTQLPETAGSLTVEVRDGSGSALETNTIPVPMPDVLNANLFACAMVSFRLADTTTVLHVSFDTADDKNAYKGLFAAALAKEAP